MKNREYDSYDLYVEHQKKKTLGILKRTGKSQKSIDRVNIRTKRFVHKFQFLSNILKRGAHSLCLGARRGEEVVALKSMGYKAVGIDLVAFPPHVIQGDFHDLPFKDNHFSFVYSNAVDHVFDLKPFSAEIDRVVKKGGYVFFHLSLKMWSEEMSLGLKSSTEVSEYFTNFSVVSKKKIKPWGGGLNCILLMKKMR